MGKVFSSGTAESLIMGLDLTSAPLGMQKRGLVDGWKRVLGMMWVGWKKSGVLLLVFGGSGLGLACGRAWPYAQGWGEAAALGLI